MSAAARSASPGKECITLPFSFCNSDRQWMFAASVQPVGAGVGPPEQRSGHLWDSRRTGRVPGICSDSTPGDMVRPVPVRVARPGSIAARGTVSARHTAFGRRREVGHRIVGDRQPPGLGAAGIGHPEGADTHSGSWETRKTSFAGQGVVVSGQGQDTAGLPWGPHTVALADSRGLAGMASMGGSWLAAAVDMTPFDRRRRLGAEGSATPRDCLSVDTLCFRDGRPPCYENQKHGPG